VEIEMRENIRLTSSLLRRLPPLRISEAYKGSQAFLYDKPGKIQAQNITATLSGTTLTVNVPDAKGWRWALIWDGAVQRSDIYSFPYTVTGFSPSRKIQLYAMDSLENYGYSREITP
jgi:hypothetical protein